MEKLNHAEEMDIEAVMCQVCDSGLVYLENRAIDTRSKPLTRDQVRKVLEENDFLVRDWFFFM